MRIALFAALALATSPTGGCPGERPAAATEVPGADEVTWGGAEANPETGPEHIDPVRISCGDVVTGDTLVAATFEHDAYGCNVGNYGGPERQFLFAPTFYGTATFRLRDATPTEVDHDVMVLTQYGCSHWGNNAVEFEAIAGDLLTLVVDGYDDDAGAFEAELACDPIDFSPPETDACAEYVSEEAEGAPIQSAAPVPSSASARDWIVPTPFTSHVPFDGNHGCSANHEGIDYIHADEGVSVVPVRAAADGVVAYVRTGCPQSTAFGPNAWSRECGAGWGNHVVVEHGDGLYTRYAHLDPADVAVRVGNPVSKGQILGGMGNSGRSEMRHLHFELGSRSEAFDSCTTSQSFDVVHDPAVVL